jgi:hypothetical protein
MKNSYPLLVILVGGVANADDRYRQPLPQFIST